MAGVPTGGNTFKNVLIGIGTTVAAYAIISFLGIGKSKSKSEATIQKQANIDVWTSVNDYLNYATEKFRTIACFSCDEQEMKKELIREMDNNINSLKTLKENKSIDDKMQSLIDRTIQQVNDLKPLYIEYFDSLSYVRSLPIPEQLPQSARIQTKYLEKFAYVQNRDTIELKNYLRDINKKHKTELALQDREFEFKPELLTRKWKIECAFFIDFKKDGTVEWTEGGNVFKGKWKLDEVEKVVNIKLETDQEFNYPILLLNEKMMIYYNKDAKALMAGCPQ